MSVFSFLKGVFLLALEAIQGEVRSEPLNRNFSKLDSNTHQNKLDINNLQQDVDKNTQKLEIEKQKTDEMNRKINAFDFTAVSPAYYDTLWALPSVTVMQCFVFCEATNEIYVSQLDGAQTGVETFLLARLTFEGVYLDHMKLVNGGHGTTFGVEVVGSDVYIWRSEERRVGKECVCGCAMS